MAEEVRGIVGTGPCVFALRAVPGFHLAVFPHCSWLTVMLLFKVSTSLCGAQSFLGKATIVRILAGLLSSH